MALPPDWLSSQRQILLTALLESHRLLLLPLFLIVYSDINRSPTGWLLHSTGGSRGWPPR
jgi:hypothetical protein